MTCLFCDLESSVQLSERLDPEELREVLAAYQHVCATVVRRFEGHIARYFGDGILVYFGFPQAHEDEAQRAVRSGLGIVEAVSQLNVRLERKHGVALRVRIGIHTGLVVAGDIAPGEELETMAAIGQTPNIAARLQSLATPDSVVISSATYQLIAGYFHCQELGLRPIRGISEQLVIYQVLNESAARTRLDVAALRELPPMAGRDAELAILAKLWHESRAGKSQAVLVVGEPGIGKSRLVWALEEYIAQSPEAGLARLSCSPYFQNTAFYAIIDYLERWLEFDSDDTSEQRLDKLEGFLAQHGFPLSDFAPLVADLLSLPFEKRYPPPDVPADRRRQVLIDAIVRTVLLRAEHQPLLFVVEDLQWADPSTMDALIQLIEQSPSARLLVVLSSRPEFAPAWPAASRLERLTLNRLDPDASRALMTAVAGQPLPEEVLKQLLDKADGVPLYLEELTKLVLETGFVRLENGRFEAARPARHLAIPATLADSLTARLDRQGSSKRIAQVGATIGRQFSWELLANVLRAIGPLNEAQLRRDLARLVQAELLVVEHSGARAMYTFRHALIQDGAYESLLRSTRQQYHQRIAEALTDRSPTASEVAPELLAHHYSQAGLIAESIPWWLRAGQRALRGSAYVEAIAHLTTGVDLLARLPDSPERASQELEFRLTIGPAYMATRGYGAAEVEDCYHRARQLCGQLGNPPQLAPVLNGLWTYHIVRGQHWTALELGQQILDLGTTTQDDALLVQGNLAVGWSQFFLGKLSAAREHLELVLALYDDERHGSHVYTFGNDPVTSAGTCLAQVYWLCGYPGRALHRIDESLRALRSLTHPYSVAFGLDVAAFVRISLGDAAGTLVVVDEAIALSREHGLPLTGSMGGILHGFAVVQQGALGEGIAQMREGLAAYVGTGAELAMPYWYWLLAEACRRAGAAADGLALLALGEDWLQRTDERYWDAEINRLRGQLLLEVGAVRDDRSAEKYYLRAIHIANEAGAKSLELRAAAGLARLRQQQGRPAEARQLLGTCYDWFTEGFDTPDLREARKLLDELETPQPSAGGASTHTT